MGGNKNFFGSQRGAQEAEVSVDESPLGGTVERHPAYGQVCVFKTSGYSALYGSDFPHQNYVTVELHESELHRSLSRDWPYAGKSIVRFSMSEAQWGSMLSSFGNGTGTQVTITERICEDGEYHRMPGILLRDSTSLFEEEGRERVARVVRNLEELAAQVAEEASGLSKVRRESMLEKIRAARQEIELNLQFVADQFGEHLEDRAERSKTEIMAWAQDTISRMGLQALAEKTGVVLQVGREEADDGRGE